MPSLPPAPSGTPSRHLRLALCQVNATVGDIGGNAEKVRGGIAEARDAGAALVLFPELAITGYPPEDLLLKEHFLRDARAAVEELATQAVGIVALVGMPERAEDVFNALAVLADGRVQGIYRKMLLPNYGVFDEQRYFQAGEEPAVLDIGNDRAGLTICEDIWEERLRCEGGRRAASAERLRDPSRRPAVRRTPPRATLLASVTAPPPPSEPLPERPLAPALSPEAEVYAALCLGLRDYVEKNGFG